MKIVLHIGMPKTGSTSIQTNFAQHHLRLKTCGIAMPLSDQKFIHPFHLARLLFSEDLDKDFSSKPKVELALAQIDRAAAARPEVLFLSSEDIAAKYVKFGILKQNLSRWSEQVRILLYLRDPVSYYRSIVQHHVKSQYYIPSPGEWSDFYIETIQAGRDIFGSDFDVIPFQRRNLHGGSIVNDAARRCGPSIPDSEDFDTVHSNSSSAAETSAVLQAFMRQFQPNQKAYGHRNTELRRFLEEFVRQNSLERKCRLKDDVRQTILAKSRDDLIRMRSEYGLVFDAIDYASLDQHEVKKEVLTYDTISQLCVLDMATVSTLADAVNASFIDRYDLPPLEM